MSATPEPTPAVRAAGAPKPGGPVPFGVNEMRLTARQWLAVAALLLLVFGLTPRLWPHGERFATGPDYRIPYDLSRDYWLYRRWLNQGESSSGVILGDSVVWGEYVQPAGTLSHFLNRDAAAAPPFLNGGVNGMFPLALEGLVRHYAPALRGRKVLLHCNPLWMTSPKVDLSTDKEEHFNHARLVPQFRPRLACYRADANERLSALVQRHVLFLSWVGHLQDAYFNQQSLLKWTLADDGSDPPRYPNVYRNPFACLTGTVPEAPAEDPLRGPASPRHKPWSDRGSGSTEFEWVGLDQSFQWRAFQRVVALLQSRGNDVFVLVGPFNEHMLTPANQAAYRQLRDGVEAWLTQHQVPHLAPAPLPSALYADASHPLTAGYEQLAATLAADPAFRRWRGAGR